MAVYTRVCHTELQNLLEQYDIGTLKGFSGISAGVTNTNYFVDTTSGRWVLTLFEQQEAAVDLPFFMALMDHLAEHDIPCAHPVARRDGEFLSTLHNRPAALVYCLQGQTLTQPGPTHCHSLGRVVAAMHQAVSDLSASRTNTRGLDWIADAARRLAPVMSASEHALLSDEIAYQQQARQRYEGTLSRAVVHADMFRDNVLFEGTEVAGVIDFYYACKAPVIFDLAVICNDWAFTDDGRFLADHWHHFMQGYLPHRPLASVERAAWPAALRAAALRFWVSRLIDACFPADGEDVPIKDPSPFRARLLAHRQSTPDLSCS